MHCWGMLVWFSKHSWGVLVWFVRHTCPAAALQGHAAALVQVEVLVTAGSRGVPLASHTHVRATPPLLWWQVPDLRPRPSPALAASQAAALAAFSAHVARLGRAYGGGAAPLVTVDLLGRRGGEAAMQLAFERLVEAQEAGSSGRGGGCSMVNVGFDYAAKCGRGRGGAVAGLAELERQLAPLVEGQGCCVRAPPGVSGRGAAARRGSGCWLVAAPLAELWVLPACCLLQQPPPPSRRAAPPALQLPWAPAPLAPARQAGLVRIHSLEAADRAGVISALVGRLGLDQCLRRLGLLEPGQGLEGSRPEVGAQGVCDLAPPPPPPSTPQLATTMRLA